MNIKPEKLRRWIVVYRETVNRWSACGLLFESRDEARRQARDTRQRHNEVKIKSVWVTV